MAVKSANGNKARNRAAEIEDGIPVTITANGDVEPIDGDSIPVVEPGDIGAPTDASPRKPGRGRPPGTGKHQQAKKGEATQDLTGVLLSLHMLASSLLKVEELELDEAEAKRLAGAVQRVNDEFGVPVLSPKQQALINLAMTGCSIYGPRIFTMRANAKKKAAEQKTETKPPVTIDGQFAQPVSTARPM